CAAWDDSLSNGLF
nr:immunoglobulin light chain junction region [Macaca mulatta]